eukprot:jgi/Psemu1/300395/fgenesh1_kg.11_\
MTGESLPSNSLKHRYRSSLNTALTCLCESRNKEPKILPNEIFHHSVVGYCLNRTEQNRLRAKNISLSLKQQSSS